MFSNGAPFTLGANLPWIRYGGDFGANAWHPNGGLGAAGVSDEVRRRVEALRSRGVTAYRWFLFCDGRAGIRFSSDGEALGIDDHVLSDLDAALQFASGAGVRIMFTLFDYLWCAPRALRDGVTTGGRRGVLSNAGHRSALLERVVSPVILHCSGHE